jgi:ferredoxin-NADP reductase
VQLFTTPASASSILAVATTVHLAMASLRNHRRVVAGPISPLAFVSLAFGLSPWLLPSIPGVVLGFVLHAAWFAACELATPPALARAAGPAVVGAANPSAVSHPQTRTAPAARPVASSGFVQAPVLATVDETPDIKTIRLARPAGFDFEAGQFLTVTIRVDGKDYARCYSISSAPDVRGYLEISVKRQGIVSNALHATARPGAVLSVRAPKGRFTYPGGDDRPIVLLAGGVGVTPLMSMLRHAIRTEPMRPVSFIYSATTERDFAFRDELASIAKRHPHVRVTLLASRQQAPAHPVRHGRIDAQLLRMEAPELAHSIAMICGPAAMIDDLKEVLAASGVPLPQIRYEVFQAAVAAAAEPAAIREVPAPPPRGDLELHAARSGKRARIAPGETLLEAADRAGIDIPSICRAGVCGTCRTRVTSGDVDCASLTLDEFERSQGFVLPCVSTARSSCTVDAC